MDTNRFIPLVIFAATASFLLSACSENRANERKPPPAAQVVAYQVTPGNAMYFDTYPATVTALEQVELRPEVSGYISDISFKDGQQVKKGDKLYSIDQQQYKAAYDQALSNLNKAQQDADRYTELSKQDAVARQTLEHALADLQSAKMQVEAVGTNLRYSVIRAPFDGTIGISMVKLGSAVTAGQTLLNTISSDNPIAVDCAVDEKQIGRFTQMMHPKPGASDSTFTIELPDQSIYPKPGRLLLMDRAVDPQTGTIRIRVVFPNAENNLRAGLTCNLRVYTGTASGSLLIPYKAVVEQMGEYFVFAVKDNIVSQRRVDLGMRINDMVVVKRGLESGEQIVLEGVQKLRDNSPVVIVPAAGKSSIP